MSLLKKVIRNIAQNAVMHVLRTEREGWPPDCATFAYQPIRPQKECDMVTNQGCKSNGVKSKS